MNALTWQTLMPEADADLSRPEVLDQLETRLQGQLQGRVRNFHLLLWGRGLILKGCSQTYYGKQLAQHAVMEATAYPIVANEIIVS